ncbi:aminoglycoside phosphotransferase family protein [Planococcus lenghuensis]|uniref:Aminoglycoside phosphotransferase domain-containing protein n=1 Tax=Planococcus lenghuensis TaxID=2213202 RepID=A0A1Q2L1V9_9BACL|nr:aminoglycoside 3'-phosphotransferase/choline kinase family protein [Planococcus lenghuensis]AQQ54411.1 hypothetical protein B0X71_15750 [Planococcus lenghuensis]
MFEGITRETYADVPQETWDKAIHMILLKEGMEEGTVEKFELGANVVYKIGGRHVIKLFPPFHGEGFQSEKAVLELLEWVNLPAETPEMMRASAYEGWPYLIMTFLEGTLAVDLWDELSRTEKLDHAEDLGRLIRSVHRLDASMMKSLPGSWPAFVEARKKKAAAYHRAADMRESLISEMTSYIESVDLNTKRQVLLTGEYTPFNLLLKKQADGWRLSGLIDFADCFVGNPKYDLLGPILFNFHREDGLTETFLRAYGLELTDGLRHELMALLLLHRFSDLPAYMEGNTAALEAESLDELARIFFPW